MKLLAVFSMCLLTTACIKSDDSDRSDHSDRYSYSSCRITYSEAIRDSDRVRDLDQCWDGADYRYEDQALDWCGLEVNDYMNDRYTFGHTVEYRVSTRNCPR
jgi:hypothetical protein